MKTSCFVVFFLLVCFGAGELLVLAPLTDHNTHWDDTVLSRAYEAFQEGIMVKLEFTFEGRSWEIPTQTMDLLDDGEGFAWGGQMEEDGAPAESSFSQLNGRVLGGIHLPNGDSFGVDVEEGGEVKLSPLTSPFGPNPLPSRGYLDFEEIRERAELEDEKAKDLEAMDFGTGRSLLDFDNKIRIIIWFDQPQCDTSVALKASQIKTILSLHYRHNMQLTNYEVYHVCQKVTEGNLDWRMFPEAFKTNGANKVRKFYGADLLIAVGKFPLGHDSAHTSGIEGGGTLGPSRFAVTHCHIDHVHKAHIITHEIGHNFGCRHDRYNAFTPNGDYACAVGARGCNFAFQDTKVKTLMAYGSSHGCTNGPITEYGGRRYVFSGFMLPNRTRYGSPDGANCANNFGKVKKEWNRVARFYSGKDCGAMTCDSGSSGSGCLCASGKTPPSAWNSRGFSHAGDKKKLELRVTEDYDCGSGTGALAGCVAVKRGDIVRIFGSSSHSASFAYVKRESSPRKKGFLPRHILKALDPTSNFAPGSANYGVKVGEILIPRRRYTGRPFNDLMSLREGDQLKVLSIPLSGRYYRVKRVRDGRVGNVLPSFVQRKPENHRRALSLRSRLGNSGRL